MKSKPQKQRAKANQDNGSRRARWRKVQFGELRVYNRITEGEIGREVLRGPNDLRIALERVLTKNPGVKDFIAHFVPGSSTMNRIPTTTSERSFAVSGIERYFTEELSHRLTGGDFDLYQRHHLEPPDEALPRIYAAIDSAIFQVAVEQGPIILLAPEILQRVTDWTFEGDSGARSWKRLGNYFAQFTLVMLGTTVSSLEGRWARNRRAIIQEVGTLRKSLQARFQTRHTLPADWVLLDAAIDTVEAEPGAFPKLAQAPLQLFLGARPQPLRNLVEGHLTPALFTDQLISWATNYRPGSVPQIIRRLS